MFERQERVDGINQTFNVETFHLLDDSTYTSIINRNPDALLEARKDFGLELNAENSKYKLILCHQNSLEIQSINTIITNKLLEVGQS
jgi:hypothetical protein